jgi:hypothetical protein
LLKKSFDDNLDSTQASNGGDLSSNEPKESLSYLDFQTFCEKHGE